MHLVLGGPSPAPAASRWTELGSRAPSSAVRWQQAGHLQGCLRHARLVGCAVRDEDMYASCNGWHTAKRT